jgi:flagellar biosynthetic protein FlhB
MVIKKEFPNFLMLYHTDVNSLIIYLMNISYKVVFYALIPMLIIAVADLFYTRWDYAENLKMTKDEVKDELKQMEGDPKIKAKQRQKMMEAMRQRMMQEVPKADVIITNPTHIAVALKYDAMLAPAPMVVAKGADHLAEKIKEVAKGAGVPIRENKPLARALYKSVEVGESIPEEMYQAVAAILASLSKFKNQGASQTTVARDN